MNALRLAFAVAATAAAAGPLLAAGPDRVKLPADYAKSFLRYSIVDRYDTKRARFMYIDTAAAAAARAGQPLPAGTVLVMEDHDIEKDAAGNPALDGNGRMRPTDKVLAVAVMEKRPGWGEAIPADIRNGDWDYASYRPDGTVNAEANLRGCFTCHLNRRDRDFTFTIWKNVSDGLKP